jgi:hypothetical protein
MSPGSQKNNFGISYSSLGGEEIPVLASVCIRVQVGKEAKFT